MAPLPVGEFYFLARVTLNFPDEVVRAAGESEGSLGEAGDGPELAGDAAQGPVGGSWRDVAQEERGFAVIVLVGGDDGCGARNSFSAKLCGVSGSEALAPGGKGISSFTETPGIGVHGAHGF